MIHIGHEGGRARQMIDGIRWATGGIGEWATLRAFYSGNRVAFIEGKRRITFAEFDRRTDQLARALRAMGVSEGDRVAGLMVNSVAFLETMFATAKLGAVFVPINFRLAAPEVAFLLADSGAIVFLWSGKLSDVARAADGGRERHDARSSGGRGRTGRWGSGLRRGAVRWSIRPTRRRRPRKFRRVPHVHLRHHWAAQGRDADARQSPVECDQWAQLRARTPRGRPHGDGRADVPHRRAGRAHDPVAVHRGHERHRGVVRPAGRAGSHGVGAGRRCSSWYPRCGPR